MKKQNEGFLIIEVLLAIVIMSMVFLTLFTVLSFVSNKTEKSKYDSQASALLQEGIEVSRSTVLSNWSKYPQDTYFPVFDNNANKWVLQSGQETLLQGKFTRKLTVSNVCRKPSDGTQTDCTFGPVDPQSKLVTVNISWVESNTQKQVEAKLLLFQQKKT